MAGKYDFMIEQGSTFYRKLTCKDSKGHVTDFSNFKAIMRFRDRIGGNLILELNSEDGDIVLTSDGIIEITIRATDTSNIKISSGVYNLKLIKPDPNNSENDFEDRFLEGKFTVSMEV